MKPVRWLLIALVLVVGGGCGDAGDSPPVRSATLLFAGDLMLGREIAPVAEADPAGMFEDVRFVVRSADIAAANLESPLTDRPHLDPAVHALEASPELAGLVGSAGFDVLALANNHAGDAGAASVVDTMGAVAAGGMSVVGGGVDAATAAAPLIVERDGLRIAYLAFDATGHGLAAGATPGVAPWDAGDAEQAVRDARDRADIVTVSIHGGIEYLARTDTYLGTIAEQLADWGADVVWGHGPHVVQPVWTIQSDERTTVVATSLGNFLFDQVVPGTTTGALLEVLVSETGVRAYRVGAVAHADRRVHFTGWDEPDGDAVLFDRAWWNPVVPAEAGDRTSPESFSPGDLTAAGVGDVTGDGERELVASFRRPFRETLVNQSYPHITWTDTSGRSAHLGVYHHDSLEQVWVAGSLPLPVNDLAVCGAGLALGFGGFGDERISATGAWVWDGFGFWYSAELAGTGTPACVDIDGDGLTEPAVVGR